LFANCQSGPFVVTRQKANISTISDSSPSIAPTQYQHIENLTNFILPTRNDGNATQRREAGDYEESPWSARSCSICSQSGNHEAKRPGKH
jgi:hypothetical protein